jgi:predicted phage tail protein
MENRSQEEMNPRNNEVLASPGREGMKQGSGISASLGAIVSSLATMGCCLPLGFAGALGAAGASAFLQSALEQALQNRP